ncbi:MAG: toll/interleukin-1 receptor domain-containing protein [Candidatus Eisenbacteria bacterium]|nr:toll/interleukin-1 receptor domain-containing protein [Candidatus Eisenbacteria bacterium]
MADVFISYSSADAELARYAHEHLTKQGVDVFTAELSLQPGQPWSEAILSNLRSSDWVIVLASEKACASPYVQQEFGIALGSVLGGGGKQIVPVVWDMEPAKLPGWMSRFQAVDLRKDLLAEIGQCLDKIAARIVSKRQQGALVLTVLLAGVVLLAASEG